MCIYMYCISVTHSNGSAVLNGENETMKSKDLRDLSGSTASSGVGSPGSTKVWLSFTTKFIMILLIHTALDFIL